MSKQFNPFDLDHSVRYLNGTIINIDNAPGYVTRCSQKSGSKNIMAEYHRLHLPGKITEFGEVDLKSNRVDFTPFKLGFINLFEEGESCWFSYRLPARVFRAGICDSNIRVYAMAPSNKPIRFELIKSKYFNDTLINQFPSITRAATIADAKNLMVAFSRDYCVDSKSLIYSGLQGKKAVGFYDRERNIVKTNSENTFLKRHIEACAWR